jgi:uncharacterized protein YndB with AHSA1/START domain
MTKNIVITKDLAAKKIHVTRQFAAPVEKVWKAWTDSALLEKWWAPKPWKAVTKNMDFTEGGLWLYSMVGPNGETHWSRVDFKTIVPGQSFSATTEFCDENGDVAPNAPASHWLNVFNATATGSVVEVEITFKEEADMQMLINMGFEGGFSMGLSNLDELLETL